MAVTASQMAAGIESISFGPRPHTPPARHQATLPVLPGWVASWHGAASEYKSAPPGQQPLEFTCPAFSCHGNRITVGWSDGTTIPTEGQADRKTVGVSSSSNGSMIVQGDLYPSIQSATLP